MVGSRSSSRAGVARLEREEVGRVEWGSVQADLEVEVFAGREAR